MYIAFSLTWPASMLIYWNKTKRLHEKRVQLPEDFLGIHCFGTPIWPPWRQVKTLYTWPETESLVGEGEKGHYCARRKRMGGAVGRGRGILLPWFDCFFALAMLSTLFLPQNGALPQASTMSRLIRHLPYGKCSQWNMKPRGGGGGGGRLR